MTSSARDRLAAARSRAAERKALDARIRTVALQVDARRSELLDLERRLAKEEADVARLAGLSMAALFASMLGKKEERLEAERADVVRATLGRDACAAALEALRADEAALQARQAEFAHAESELADAMRAREAEVRASGGPVAQRVANLDALDAEAASVEREVVEAIAAADDAERAIGRVAASLESAESWGTWDMIGGGTITTMVKHSRIDDARAEARGAQAALDRLSRELADIRGAAAATLVVEIDGFSRFADYLFDGLIIDWMVQNRICESLRSVRSARRQVVSVRDGLGSRLKELRAERARLATERTAMLAG